MMSKRTEYYLEGAFCRKMADKATSAESRERWLELSRKWQALGDGTYGQGVIENFTAAVNRVRSGS